jgi:DNA-binding response OmpR family regulator
VTLIDRSQLMTMMTMAADMGGHGGGPLRILVVEDEALVALEIESIITTAGHVVVGVAEDRVSAAELARRTDPRPNLALVDMRLANGASGLEVAADLIALGIAVLFVTGNCPAERGQGLAVGCLHKPFTEGELLASVAAAEAVLRRRPLPRRLPSGLHLYDGG